MAVNTYPNLHMNSAPKIAVLLAAYNGKAWIEEQIITILQQKDVSVKIFVSVDRSKDGTEALVDELAHQNSEIVVLPHGMKLGGAGPNFYRLLREVDFSIFDYVAFSDQDDIWLPNKLIRGIQQLEKNKADGYSSNVTAFWSDGRQSLIVKSQPQTKWDFLFESAGPGCSYVMTEKLGRDLQSIIKLHQDEMNKIFAHDWVCYALARARGYHWIIDDFSGVNYRQHDKNEVGANVGYKALLSRAKKVINGWGLGQSIKIAKMAGLETDSFVTAWSDGTRLGYLRLALNAFECRRRFRDKILFLFACLAMSVWGTNPH